MKNEARSLKWEHNIKEARELVVSAKGKPYIRIAQLALEVCEITWGGSKKKIAGNPYTLRRFAAEIGVNPKTLSNYCAVYRNIHSRVPAHISAGLSLSEAKTISGSITRDTPREEVMRLVQDHKSIHSFERKVARYLRNVRALAHNFQKQGAALVVSEPLLEEVTFYCQAVLTAIKRDRRGVLAKNNGLARTNDNNTLSIAKATLGARK